MHHAAGRLRLLEQRDGPAAAQAFALRMLRVYRAAVKRGKVGRRSG